MATARQQAWTQASDEAVERGDAFAAGFFALVSLPNDQERPGHRCVDHTVGFSRDGRRGFKCGICREVVKWVDR